ncbi:MAG TPA: hypothetical protein VFX59_21590 [Polyangiales bacterium]|nr:hypothetical protein [Polyangiales bacterium]
MKSFIGLTCALSLLAGCELSTSDDDGDDEERTGTATGERDAARGTSIPVEAGTPTTDAASPGSSTDASNPPVTPGGPLPAGFQHSNIASGAALTKYGALSISHSVGLDTDALAFTGAYADPSFKPQLVSTADGELAVLYVESLVTTTGGAINVAGERPLVIIAEKTIDHAGWIGSVASGTNGYAAGGAPGSSSPERRGFGPGGGSAGNATTGGGGGSFCGLGGVPLGGTPAAAYGDPSLIPLVGGSAGGSANGGSASAGGAVELVAGVSLLIKETGGINVPGRGTDRNAGGSSGGAILLESPQVTVLGVLAANGASGGGPIYGGVEGTITSTPANQGHDEAIGQGSAGAVVNGGNGTSARAAGGGGAGRIRINGAKITLGANAVITPSKDTPCYSQGTL